MEMLKLRVFKARKRGQGISLTMIVLAAIALIILLVMIAIFSGKAKLITSNLESCEAKGGECSPKEKSCADHFNNPSYGPLLGFTCTNKEEKCCIKTMIE